MNRKYTMNLAMAKRIAAKLCTIAADRFTISYEDVCNELRAENVYRAEAAIDDLMHVLRESGKSELVHVAGSIADACARAACDRGDTLRDIRRAFSALGVVFEDELKRETFKGEA